MAVGVASLLALFGSSSRAQAETWGWQQVVDGSIPSQAVYYGVSGNQSYVCGNWYGSGPNSGRVVNNRCIFSYEGAEHSISDYYVLITQNGYRWVEFSKFDEFPSNALYNSPQSRDPKVYICAVQFNDYYLTGQVYDQRCHVAFNGKDYYFGYYMIPLAN